MAHRLPKADVNFGNMTDSELLAVAQNIHDKMLASGTFPTPPIAYVDLQTLIDAYRAFSAAAVKGSKSATAAKNNAKADLIMALRTLASYVNAFIYDTYADTARNLQHYDELKGLILDTGFKVQKDPEPVTEIPVPIILEATSDASGTIRIRLKNYAKYKRNIKVYIVRLRPIETPAAPWETRTFTSSRIILTDLTPGKTYEFQIAAQGGDSRDKTITTNFSSTFSRVVV